MLIKSQMLTQASGSLGGLTASHNKGGMYLRARATPTNPNSPQQQAVRGLMQAYVDAWTNTLTAAQRDAWNVYAANVPVTNRLGETVTRSGQQWYIACNVPRAQEGGTNLPDVDDAPIIFDRGSFTPPTIDSFTPATPSVDLVIVNTDAWANEDEAALLIYASRPQNPSVNYYKGPYRLAGAILGDAVTPPTSPATVTLPFAVSVGQTVHFRVRSTRADGRLSASTYFRGTAS